jgi:thioredoxin-dependent peroxiredoxin
MRLKKGQQATSFQVLDIFDEPINLQDYKGKKLLLSFYRYAACPLCNLRVHSLIQKYPEFQSQGLYLMAFFESSKESIARYVGKQDAPFPIIADPERSVYKEYGIESSWFRFMWSMVIKMPAMISALFKGFPPGKLENDKALLPADFLIGPDLEVVTAFYGSNIGDHLPIREIEEWLKK